MQQRQKQPKDSQIKAALKEFIKDDPLSQYTFDSERGSSESELCREDTPNGRECIKLRMDAKKLFEAMQDQGFFCSLPMDPERTYMQCRPIPKN